jgi:hypothetical protein
MVLRANRYILPAAFEYQKVGQNVGAVKAAGGKSVEGKKVLDTVTTLCPVPVETETNGAARSYCSTRRRACERDALRLR